MKNLEFDELEKFLLQKMPFFVEAVKKAKILHSFVLLNYPDVKGSIRYFPDMLLYSHEMNVDIVFGGRKNKLYKHADKNDQINNKKN